MVTLVSLEISSPLTTLPLKKHKFNDKNIIVATLNGLISFLTIFHPPKF